jgi:predicted ATP-dependent serine protease
MSSALTSVKIGDIFSEMNGLTGAEVDIPDFYYQRHKSGIECLDILFGGKDNPGIRPCTNIMLSAVRGGGKTTILLQYLSALQASGIKTAFISNEETVPEVAILSKRVNATNVPLFNLNDVDEIIKMIDQDKLDVVVVDSFNGLTTNKVDKNKSRYALTALMKKVIDYKNGHPCSLIKCVHAKADGKGEKSNLGSDLGHLCHVTMYINRPKGKENPYGLENVREIYTDKNRTGSEEKIALQMTATGYDFDNPLQPVEEEAEVDGRAAEKQRRHDMLLLHLEDHTRITLEETISLLGCSEPTARLDLKALEDQKLVVKIGRGKTGYFETVVDKPES